MTIIFDRHLLYLDMIMPALFVGITVVADRGFLSTLAYAAGNDLAWQPLLQAHEEILGEMFIMPDQLFFIDIPVEVGLARTMEKQQGKKDYFDTEELLTKIYNRYVELIHASEIANNTHCIVIQADNASPEDVHEEIWHYVHPFVSGVHP